jgi:hypothetical protein
MPPGRGSSAAEDHRISAGLREELARVAAAMAVQRDRFV